MKKEKRSNVVFYNLMGIMLVLFLISLVVTGGKSIYQFLFYDRKDIFMDFFNSIYDCFKGDPYGKKCIYPPLTYVIYTIFGKFLPMDMAMEKKHGIFDVRDTTQGLTVYFIYTLIILVILLALIWKFLKGDSRKKLQFSIMILMSMPVIYSFDRGNIVWFCMAFLMVYIFTYDSKNKILREIGLISLAIATSIKIYPVVFGLLLLFDKRWAEAKRCIIYGVLIFFVPFLCFGGFSDFGVLLSNLTKTSSLLGSKGHGYRLNFQNTLLGICDILKYRGPRIDATLELMLKVFYVFFIPCIFLAKERWKKVFLLTAVLVGMPPFSYAYSMVFVIIPLMLFLNENKGKPRDIFYAVCFVFCIAPIGYNPTSVFGDATQPYVYTLNVLLMSVALMALTGFLALETWMTRITEVLLPRRSK